MQDILIFDEIPTSIIPVRLGLDMHHDDLLLESSPKLMLRIPNRSDTSPSVKRPIFSDANSHRFPSEEAGLGIGIHLFGNVTGPIFGSAAIACQIKRAPGFEQGDFCLLSRSWLAFPLSPFAFLFRSFVFPFTYRTGSGKAPVTNCLRSTIQNSGILESVSILYCSTIAEYSGDIEPVPSTPPVNTPTIRWIHHQIQTQDLLTLTLLWAITIMFIFLSFKEPWREPNYSSFLVSRSLMTGLLDIWGARTGRSSFILDWEVGGQK
ncbi:hypothetical protein BJX99DRAFT_4526 [Aspergillus californicus]